MANVKISDLPAASTPLSGAELVPIVQSGVTSQTTVDALALDPLATSAGASLVGFLQSNTGAVATTVQTKLRETVSVFDFMPAEQITYIKAGNTASQDGAVVKAAIQAAIDSLSSAGGSIFFPNGTYSVSSMITLKSRVTLYGEDRNNTVIKANTAGITVMGISGSAYNMRIRHLAIDGNDIAAKGIAILGASNGSNAHHVLEDVIVSGCTTNNIHLKFIIYGRLVNVYSSQGNSTAPTTSVLLEDMLNTDYEQCVFYNGTTSTVHVLRGSENYFHKTTIYNDTSYPATQLVLLDSGTACKFDACTFEPQGDTNVTSTITIQNTTTGDCADHSFIGCRFIGLPATKTQDINVGASGGAYKTKIKDCQFIKPTSTSSILLTSQQSTEIDNCVDLITYDTPTYANVSVTNNSGTVYAIREMIYPYTASFAGSFTGSVSDPTIDSYTTNAGRYTITHDRVFFDLYIEAGTVSAAGTGGLQITLGSLPAVSNVAAIYPSVVISQHNIGISAGHVLTGSIANGSNIISFSDMNGPSTGAAPVTLITTGSYVRVSGSYPIV